MPPKLCIIAIPPNRKKNIQANAVVNRKTRKKRNEGKKEKKDLSKNGQNARRNKTKEVSGIPTRKE